MLQESHKTIRHKPGDQDNSNPPGGRRDSNEARRSVVEVFVAYEIIESRSLLQTNAEKKKPYLPIERKNR